MKRRKEHQKSKKMLLSVSGRDAEEGRDRLPPRRGLAKDGARQNGAKPGLL
jgi:hypothetical protein